MTSFVDHLEKKPGSTQNAKLRELVATHCPSMSFCFTDAAGAPFAYKPAPVGESMKSKTHRHYFTARAQEVASLFTENVLGESGAGESHRSDDGGWNGAKLKDYLASMQGELNMNPYLKAREKLDGVMRELEPVLQELSPKRRRAFSEHDGEWQREREWEIAPFASTRRQPVASEVIDVHCYMSASSGVDADAFAKAAAQSWAICDLLEGAGFLTRIILDYSSVGCLMDSKTMTDEPMHILLSAKEPEEYCDIKSLARFFQVGFFRRTLFDVFKIQEALSGHKLSYGYGRPMSVEVDKMKKAFSEPGFMFLSSTQQDDFSTKPEQLVKFIRGAIQ